MGDEIRCFLLYMANLQPSLYWVRIQSNPTWLGICAKHLSDKIGDESFEAWKWMEDSLEHDGKDQAALRGMISFTYFKIMRSLLVLLVAVVFYNSRGAVICERPSHQNLPNFPTLFANFCKSTR